jgi:hypothetical protein
MESLILIRRVMLSNQIAGTRQPEGILARYHRAPRSMAEITLSHLRKKDCYKERVLSGGIRTSAPTRLTFRDPEEDYKMLSRILFTLQTFLPIFTLETGPCMPGHQYTQAE